LSFSVAPGYLGGKNAAMGTVTPTIRLRRLGAALRHYREAAGLTLEEGAALLQRSPSSLSRIEKGLHHIPVRDLEYILNKYGATDKAANARLYDWCRNGRRKGWWQTYAEDLSAETMDLIGLEADSVSIDFFELILIPGLLQTEAYARALIGQGPFADDPERVDRLVNVRMQRQEILGRPAPPHIHAIVDEAALHRQVGGPDVMRAQLRRLAEAARHAHVTLQVLPYAAGAYTGMTGAFTILDVGEPGDLRVVAVDSLTQISYREEDAEIRTYVDAFEHLRTAALPEPDSLALINRLVSRL
jgi:transcriptional regulator with XRE-family HTH domain